MHSAVNTLEYEYKNSCADLFMECEGDCEGCPNKDYWNVYLAVRPPYLPRFPRFVVVTQEDDGSSRKERG